MTAEGPASAPLVRWFDWWFRDRTTGRIVIAQWPNLPLGLFLAASVARWVLGPSGWLATVLTVLATGALWWWAVDEVVRGVNPWRRLLGGAVLAVSLAGTLARLT